MNDRNADQSVTCEKNNEDRSFDDEDWSFGKNYGERICMTCGKKFIATKPGVITCSKECKRARSNKMRHDLFRHREEKYKAVVDENQLLRDENRMLKAKLAKLQQK